MTRNSKEQTSKESRKKIEYIRPRHQIPKPPAAQSSAMYDVISREGWWRTRSPDKSVDDVMKLVPKFKVAHAAKVADIALYYRYLRDGHRAKKVKRYRSDEL